MDDLITNTFDPKAMDELQVRALARTLFEPHHRVFDRVHFDKFFDYLSQPDTTRTRIQGAFLPDGRAVGYTAVHFYELEFRGRPCVLVRMASGFDPRFRGKSGPGAFLAQELARYRLARPGWDMYGVSFVVHPRSYKFLAQFMPDFHPNWNEPTPDDLQEFMISLADRFGFPAVEGAQPLVRDVGWVARDTAQERTWWARTDDPAARFYASYNPGSADGHGIILFCNFSAAGLASGIGRLAQHTLSRRWEQAVSELQGLGLGTRVPTETAARLLSDCRLFDEVAPEALQALGEVAERRNFPAGARLVRQGDPSEALHVVVDGEVQVELEQGADRAPLIVDQLGAGSVIGESGVLLECPRGATVRALTATETLQVARQAFLDVLDEHPSLAQRVWHVVAARRLENLLLSSGPFRELGADERHHVLDHLRLSHLTRSAVLPLGQADALFVVKGRVEVKSKAGWSLVEAPAMLSPGARSTCHATEPAVVARVALRFSSLRG